APVGMGGCLVCCTPSAVVPAVSRRKRDTGPQPWLPTTRRPRALPGGAGPNHEDHQPHPRLVHVVPSGVASRGAGVLSPSDQGGQMFTSLRLSARRASRPVAFLVLAAMFAAAILDPARATAQEEKFGVVTALRGEVFLTRPVTPKPLSLK